MNYNLLTSVNSGVMHPVGFGECAKLKRELHVFYLRLHLFMQYNGIGLEISVDYMLPKKLRSTKLQKIRPHDPHHAT
jgi:hypothetical protein